MPLTTATEKALLGLEYGDTVPTIPGTKYIGLMAASTWLASTAYAVGAYVVPTTFGSLSGSVGRVFKATAISGTGTSGASQPTWPTTAGGTVVDNSGANQITWTEVSNLFAANTFAGIEPSAGAYGRVAVVNNTTNFPVPTGGDPASVSNGVALNFPTTTASWGQLVGVLDFDALTTGNLRSWGLFSAVSAIATVVGVAPQIAASGFVATML